VQHVVVESVELLYLRDDRTRIAIRRLGGGNRPQSVARADGDVDHASRCRAGEQRHRQQRCRDEHCRRHRESGPAAHPVTGRAVLDKAGCVIGCVVGRFVTLAYSAGNRETKRNDAR